MNLDGDSEQDDDKESNSTCFEAVSAKNSKLSASEQSSKTPGLTKEDRSVLKRHKHSSGFAPEFKGDVKKQSTTPKQHVRLGIEIADSTGIREPPKTSKQRIEPLSALKEEKKQKSILKTPSNKDI